MVNYADFTVRSADLACDFGESFARKYFDSALLDSLPRYVRGAKKGKLKGSVEWTRCVRGGWVRAQYGEGYAENRVNQITSVALRGAAGFNPRMGTVPGRILATVTSTLEMQQAEAAARAEAEATALAEAITRQRDRVAAWESATLDVEYFCGNLGAIEIARKELELLRAELAEMERK